MATVNQSRKAVKTNVGPATRFDKKLVLNQWMLNKFKVDQFAEFAIWLQDGDEGLNTDGVHKFFGVLEDKLRNQKSPLTDLLRVYEDNIARHTKKINESRLTAGEDTITWKYFQYLALLFTEIYLDQYFTQPGELLEGVNHQIDEWNAKVPSTNDTIRRHPTDGRAWEQLNKLSYWSATGSGKTLLMHVNILQYRHYLEMHGNGAKDGRQLNRIILLTPNEGLSAQHKLEFDASGIPAEIFVKQSRTLDMGTVVEIIDLNKLSDSARDGSDTKTVSPDAFETNNLVLVDEGHRGSSGASWMSYRNRLSATGFSFEYSATFGQAVKGNQKLTDHYAKNILVDYSYRHFYQDGFGKNYQILNIDETTQSQHERLYLTGCLLAFYQQLRLYNDDREALKPFNVEKPLWVFVGGSVTKSVGKKDASDVLTILGFFQQFLSDPAVSRGDMDTLLEDGLIGSNGKDIFSGRLNYLRSLNLSSQDLWANVLELLFNAPAGGRLEAQNLKGIDGEIALHVGQGDAFGVINVGDDSKVVALCEKRGLATRDNSYSKSLFKELNGQHSRVNLLIGSRKFSEGWSSWRVSTMGLMNIGKSEGSQIIQLFGRGVRLKGHEMSLKRGTHHAGETKYLDYLQTLNVFGVHADYMAQFREYLEDEGLPTDSATEVRLPVTTNPIVHTGELLMIDLEDHVDGVRLDFGDAFKKKGPVPTLLALKNAKSPNRAKLVNYFKASPVTVNLYPKLQSLAANESEGSSDDSSTNEDMLRAGHLAFLDYDQLYFEVEHLKSERGWSNFNIPATEIPQILADISWYKLMIPARELAFDSFGRVALWQEIATILLRKYAERFYTFSKHVWESKHLEYRPLLANHPNLTGRVDEVDQSFYRIMVPEEAEHAGALQKFQDLSAAILTEGASTAMSIEGVKTLSFSQHLYEPLLCVDKSVIQVSPTPLNAGESKFMTDLSKYWRDSEEDFFEDKRLYVLRNLSRGRGIGFFEAGNFYPDFILWLLVGDTQHIIFVDPKGIGRMSEDHPKLNFGATIKQIEKSIASRTGELAANVQLHSFIVSNTQFADLNMSSNATKASLKNRNVLFQVDDQATYIEELFERVMEGPPVRHTP